MGRRKIISDENLLQRLMPALRIHGPAELTFAKAAEAAGLAAATLVQRFGTRPMMVELIMLQAWNQLDEDVGAADAECSLDAQGAVELLLRLTGADGAEYYFNEGLLLLREDIQNPVLRLRGAAWGSRLAVATGRRLCSDATRGERLGWQMVSVWQGALIWWAFRQDGDLRANLRTVLNDWCLDIGASSEGRGSDARSPLD